MPSSERERMNICVEIGDGARAELHFLLTAIAGRGPQNVVQEIENPAEALAISEANREVVRPRADT